MSAGLGPSAEARRGDAVGLALAATLVARAAALPPSGRAHLLARAATLRAAYEVRLEASPRARARVDPGGAWREALEARARARAPRPAAAARSTRILAEVRASAATARAAEEVPASAGPYNGAAVVARALEALVAIAPAYVSGTVAWLEDLASLADVAERRGAGGKPRA